MRLFIIIFFLIYSLTARVVTNHLEYIKLENIGYSWQTVSLTNSYNDAIVVCTNVLESSSKKEALVRIKDITSSSFKIKLQSPIDEDPAYQTSIYCIISEEGSFTVPFKYEAHKVLSTKTANISNWKNVSEDVTSSLEHSYSEPVVLGQVMSYNDNKFSLFWSHNCVSRKDPFNGSSNLCVGKHTSKDTTARVSETVGYIVVESGETIYNNIKMRTELGANKIRGVDNSPPYSYNLYYGYEFAVATKEAENGGHGGWAVLYGINPVSNAQIDLAIDESTNDGSDRTHMREEVGYWAFSYMNEDLADMVINEVLFAQLNSDKSNEEFVEFYVTKSGNLQNFLVTDQEDHEYWFPNHEVKQGDYVLLFTGSGSNSSSNGVHKFYMGLTPIWNDTGDDVVLLKPSSTDTTDVDNKTLNVVPVDYIAYYAGSSSAIDPIPQTTQSPTIKWNDGNIDGKNIQKLQSISLTPNGNDTDSAKDWEKTTSDTASGPRTRDTNDDVLNGVEFICSDGESNTLLPSLTITKSSIVISDPINATNNPKRVPGAILRYCFVVDNESEAAADDILLKDVLSNNNKEHLLYQKSGKIIQNINNSCDCLAISDNSGTFEDNEVKIEIGTLTGSSYAPETARACAYIEVEIE